MNYSPAILALDFDGVVCNGLREYFQTSQRTYQKIWKSETSVSLEGYAESFYKVRPVIETGWEMPLLIRAMVKGKTESEILQHWPHICADLMEADHLEKEQLIQALDGVRDDWITTNLEEWLGLHQFYSGVISALKKILNSSTKLYIITTKEGRFVKQLLHNQGVEIPQSSIYGKEVKQPKSKTLQLILQDHSEQPNHLWFVEDLLKTLNKVNQEKNLTGISLYLAEWGYNTPEVRASLTDKSNIKLLSLEKFTQDFSQWLS
ncbi:MAG: HAD family hydrolase [Microcystaceae cyanobacterium]